MYSIVKGDYTTIGFNNTLIPKMTLSFSETDLQILNKITIVNSKGEVLPQPNSESLNALGSIYTHLTDLLGDFNSLGDFNLSFCQRVMKDLKVNRKGYIDNLDPCANSDLWQVIFNSFGLPSRAELLEHLTHEQFVNLINKIYQIIFLILYLPLNQNLVNMKRNNLQDTQEYTEISKLRNSLHKLINSLTLNWLKNPTCNISLKGYVGFDTEYNQEEFLLNKLVSVQLLGTGTAAFNISHTSLTYDLSAKLTGQGQRYHTRAFDFLESNFDGKLDLINVLFALQYLLALNKPDVSIYLKFINFLDTKTSEGLLLKEVKDNGTIRFIVPPKTSNNWRDFEHKFLLTHEYSLTKLIADTKCLVQTDINDSINKLNGYFNEFTASLSDSNSDLGLISDSNSNSNSNLNFNLVSKDTVSKDTEYTSDDQRVNFFKNSRKVSGKLDLTILSHFSVADFSILSDFHTFKHYIDIYKGTFTTLSKSFTLDGCKVTVRDTIALSPPSMSSLAAIGNMYNIPKLVIPKEAYNDMLAFQKADPELFLNYAITDSLIALVHGLKLQQFSLDHAGQFRIPSTLPSLAKNMALKFWYNQNIPQFQLFRDYHIGDFNSIFTSKGLQTVNKIGIALPSFVSAFRGGRNESFIYGVDRTNTWYDNDLVGAYPTGMASLGIPNHDNLVIVPQDFSLSNFFQARVENVHQTNFLELPLDGEGPLAWQHCYAAFDVTFTFPPTVKYPCIPVHLDETTTIYPKTGRSITTVYELYLAHKLGAELQVHSGFIIPFMFDYNPKGLITGYSKPYGAFLKYLINKRGEYNPSVNPFENLIFKLLAVSTYGQTAMGLNKNTVFDSRTGLTTKTSHGELTNPFIAQATTGFTRAVLSELLNDVLNMGGKVISCTTDGFLTNIADLEEYPFKGELAGMYKESRKLLTGSSQLLEVKHTSKGVASWSTRGQLGLGDDSTLAAITGFQRKLLSVEELQDLVSKVFESGNYSLTYIQQSLSKARTSFDYGHVTRTLREQIFNFEHDGRRLLDTVDYLPCKGLVDSSPHNNIGEALEARAHIKALKSKYEGSSNYTPDSTRISTNAKLAQAGVKGQFLKAAILMFVRGYYGNALGINNHEMLDPPILVALLRDFIRTTGLETDLNFKNSNFVRNHRNEPFLAHNIPKTQATLLFAKYIANLFPGFDTDLLFIN